MIDIPPEVQIRATIRVGSVYKFVEEALQSDKPHYFIVLNNPIIDKVVLLVYCSSKIKKIKRWRKNLKGTLVEIKKDEYSDFTRDSIVDCNTIFEKTVENIIQKLEKNELKQNKEMDLSTVEKIKQAVIISPLVDNRIKELLQK